MKKVFLMLVAVATFALASCSGNAKDSDSASKKSDVKSEKVENKAAAAEKLSAAEIADKMVDAIKTSESGEALKTTIGDMFKGVVAAYGTDAEGLKAWAGELEKIDEAAFEQKVKDALASNPKLTENDVKDATENAFGELAAALMK